jgi:hypothetical protein
MRKQAKNGLASDTSLVLPKIKKRPRGHAFEKGNTYSLPHRFKKNEPSPNPSGRPKSREINKASREYLKSDIGQSPRIETNAQAIVHKIGHKAKKGDLGCAMFLANRAEGLPVQGLSINNENDPLSQLVELMSAESKKLGPPEGFIPTKKLTGEIIEQ